MPSRLGVDVAGRSRRGQHPQPWRSRVRCRPRDAASRGHTAARAAGDLRRLARDRNGGGSWTDGISTKSRSSSASRTSRRCASACASARRYSWIRVTSRTSYSTIHPDRCEASGRLLRLRRDRRARLTFKEPVAEGAADPRLKVRREVEVEVSNFENAREILEGIGYRVSAGYEKERETWRLHGASVCLDELEFGRFIEIEGEPAEIERVAADLGLDLRDGITRSYLDLHEPAVDPPGPAQRCPACLAYDCREEVRPTPALLRQPRRAYSPTSERPDERGHKHDHQQAERDVVRARPSSCQVADVG